MKLYNIIFPGTSDRLRFLGRYSRREVSYQITSPYLNLECHSPFLTCVDALTTRYIIAQHLHSDSAGL